MQQNESCVAIVGLGPRGLSLFERFLSFASTEKFSNFQFTIYLFDPGLPGAGVHTTDQDDFILLNTPAYLPTLFPGNIFSNSALSRDGLSFQQWLSTVSKSSYQEESHSLQPETYLPRKLLGEYLHWVYHVLMNDLPKNVTVLLVNKEVNSISRHNDSYKIDVEGKEIIADSVFLSIGHGERSPTEKEAHIIRNPYPIKKIRDSSFKKIAIGGMGLVAFDIISACTVGLGGRFIRNKDQRLEYFRSGKEPTIYLFSRSGIPYSARPLQEDQFRYRPILLTRENISKIRRNKPRLDFAIDIVPLLADEMSISYYLSCVQNKNGVEQFNDEYKIVEDAVKSRVLDQWLNEKKLIFGEFNPYELIEPQVPKWTTAKSYREWFISYIEKDIIEAQRGARSSLKWAAEAMLLTREGIREAVEFDGLTPSSSIDFFTKYSPLINKNAIGPELQRVEELYALIESGIIDLSLGPNPSWSLNGQKVQFSATSYSSVQIEVDVYCEAYLKTIPLEQWASPLVKNMIHEGIILPNSNKNPCQIGVQVDRSFRVISKDQKKSKVWIIGIMTEGTTYYNNYVPIVYNGEPSTPFIQAHEAVNSYFSNLSSLSLPTSIKQVF